MVEYGLVKTMALQLAVVAKMRVVAWRVHILRIDHLQTTMTAGKLEAAATEQMKELPSIVRKKEDGLVEWMKAVGLSVQETKVVIYEGLVTWLSPCLTIACVACTHLHR